MKNLKKKKRIVILGSDSFIASYLKKVFFKNKIKFLSINRKKIDFEKDNSKKKLSKVLKKDDTCIFIAANAPVKNEKMFLSNILIAKNICSVIKDKNLNQVIYISSDAIYSDSKKKINENSLTKPENLHGLMHLTREIMLKNIIEEKKLTIIRPTLIYGDGDPHNGYGPNQFLRLAKKNRDIKLFGKGEELRDHINVEDVAFIICSTIVKKITGPINLVTGKVISFFDIAKKVIKISNSKSKIVFLKRTQPMPHNGYRAFDPAFLKKKIKNLKLKTFK